MPGQKKETGKINGGEERRILENRNLGKKDNIPSL